MKWVLTRRCWYSGAQIAADVVVRDSAEEHHSLDEQNKRICVLWRVVGEQVPSCHTLRIPWDLTLDGVQRIFASNNGNKKLPP
jgi:hypothetical protein